MHSVILSITTNSITTITNHNPTSTSNLMEKRPSSAATATVLLIKMCVTWGWELSRNRIVPFLRELHEPFKILGYPTEVALWKTLKVLNHVELHIECSILIPIALGLT
ncbi:hypothetical protein NC651_020121 [Populus alba x Populus x berolinensis]|nr:hypothetical protein NC651_020121 [Populus alba x Populus x berolinensis]